MKILDALCPNVNSLFENWEDFIPKYKHVCIVQLESQ